jgi:hypothetical protein
MQIKRRKCVRINPPIEQGCKALKALCHCMVAEFEKVSKAECGNVDANQH